MDVTHVATKEFQNISPYDYFWVNWAENATILVLFYENWTLHNLYSS